jgi:hypothetical protein
MFGLLRRLTSPFACSNTSIPHQQFSSQVERSKTRRKYHALLIADFYNKIVQKQTNAGAV